MMKKLIGVLMLLGVALASFGQTYKYIPGTGYIWERGEFLKGLHIPSDNSDSINGPLKRGGAIRWNPDIDSVQYWDGSTWFNFATSNIPGLDSAWRSNDTLYFRSGPADVFYVDMDYYTKTQLTDSLSALTLERVTTSSASANTTSRELITDAGSGFGRMRFFTANAAMNRIYSMTTGAGAFRPLWIGTGGLVVSDIAGSLVGWNGVDALQVQGTGFFNGTVSGNDAIGNTDFVNMRQGDDRYLKSTIIESVDDLDEFSAPKDSIIFVKDTLRGGTFIWKSTGMPDNGIVFAGANGYWHRQYDQSAGRSVAWYGARPDDASDDTGPIQTAINSSAKTNIFFPFGEYHLTSITFNKAIENIDGRGSTIMITGSDTAAIIVPLTVYFHDFLIKKDPSCTTPVAFRISGSRCYIENITGTGPFANFFDCYAMRESHFKNLRIDNDTTNYTGVVFRLNSVINNTITNSQFSFGDTCFFLTAAQHPIYNYRTEGLNITNCVTTLFDWAVVIDWGTQIMITDNVFDFNRSGGIFQSNGKSTVIQGNWIAGWDTNGFLGIGATNGVTGGSITGNQIHAGALPITGVAFQITGLNYIAANNYYADLDGGVITDVSAQVYGNTYTNGTGISSVAGSTQINNSFQIMKYGMTGGEPAGTEYSKNGFTLTTTGGSVYRTGVKYNRGAFSDLIQQRFFVASGGGAETDVMTLDGNTSSVGIRTTGPTSTLDIAGPNGFNQFRLRTTFTPSSSADSNGNTGDVSWDDNYLYIKTSTGWKRAALSTF